MIVSSSYHQRARFSLYPTRLTAIDACGGGHFWTLSGLPLAHTCLCSIIDTPYVVLYTNRTYIYSAASPRASSSSESLIISALGIAFLLPSYFPFRCAARVDGYPPSSLSFTMRSFRSLSPSPGANRTNLQWPSTKASQSS
jgi:hypothetical protein